ncbi:MAG: hypothetical protein ABIP75_17245 [Pyrinomonadaceae bacterium]
MTETSTARSTIESRELLRHTVATLAYRGGKAVAGDAAAAAGFHAGEKSRTPAEILAHVGDLLDWALSMAQGRQRWNDSEPLPWTEEVARFHAALARFDDYLASEQPLGCSVEKLFQGPVADALTHVGQINLLRRLAGAPIRGENYSRAKIIKGRVGPDQSADRVEFE